MKRIAVWLAAAALAAQMSGPERQARVEKGLRHGVEITGQPPRTFDLLERMEHYRVPGVSIAVMDGGQLVFAQAYGMADVETKRAVTPETLFQAASISKPVAAIAAMRLVEQGKLSLDEDVSLKLKAWKLPGSPALAKQKITLRRLLSHTAGTNVHGFAGYAPGAPVPSLLQVLNGEPPANSKPVVPELEPGSRWRYSGGGYQIVQLLIEEATGRPFALAARELVLQPLGMRASTFEQPLPAALRGRAATGYRPGGRPVEGGFHTYPEQAAAGLWTTPSDLLRVAREIQSGGTVLRKETVAEMMTGVLGNYGPGFALQNTASQASFSHGGSNEGFGCQFFAYREGGRGVAVMTNGDRGGPLTAEILRAVAAEFQWPDFRPETKQAVSVPASDLAKYAGRYAFADGPVATVRVQGDRVLLDTGLTGLVELFPETPNRFFTVEGGLPPVAFAINEAGAVVMKAGNLSAVLEGMEKHK